MFTKPIHCVFSHDIHMFMTTIVTEFNVRLEALEADPRCDCPDLIIASEKFNSGHSSNIINILDVVIVYGRC